MSLRTIREWDLTQLRRVEASIASIENRSPAEQVRLGCLLGALQDERAELLRGGVRRPAAMPALRGDGHSATLLPTADEGRRLLRHWYAGRRKGENHAKHPLFNQ